MKRILLEVSDELAAAVDAARGNVPRNPWIEKQLWKSRAVKQGAAAAGVEDPGRPLEGRGGNKRANAAAD